MTMEQKEKPTQTMLKLTAEDDKTHALLCAITQGKRQMKERSESHGHNRWGEYAEYLEEWEEEVMDAYFHDRRVEDPTIDFDGTE